MLAPRTYHRDGGVSDVAAGDSVPFDLGAAGDHLARAHQLLCASPACGSALRFILALHVLQELLYFVLVLNAFDVIFQFRGGVI